MNDLVRAAREESIGDDLYDRLADHIEQQAEEIAELREKVEELLKQTQ